MALSDEEKRVLRIAIADKDIADGIIEEIESGSNPQGAAVADIVDTSTADAEAVGDKLNELLQSLRAAGIIAS